MKANLPSETLKGKADNSSYLIMGEYIYDNSATLKPIRGPWGIRRVGSEKCAKKRRLVAGARPHFSPSAWIQRSVTGLVRPGLDELRAF